MAIVILEGPDGAGKSTLADALVEMNCPWRWRESHHTAQPRHHCGAYFEYLLEVENMMSYRRDVLQVYDRFHLGELVYGPVMRDGSDLTEREARVLESLLDKLGVVKVMVDAPDDVLFSRAFEDRGEDFVQGKDQLLEVARRYRALQSVGGFQNWITVNTAEEKTTESCRQIWRTAKEVDVRRAVMYRA